MLSSCRDAMAAVIRWLPLLRAVATATSSEKKNQTCAPFPDRDRSTSVGWFWRRRSNHGTAPALAVLQTRAGDRSKAGGQRPLIARSVLISAGTAARCKE